MTGAEGQVKHELLPTSFIKRCLQPGNLHPVRHELSVNLFLYMQDLKKQNKTKHSSLLPPKGELTEQLAVSSLPGHAPCLSLFLWIHCGLSALLSSLQMWDAHTVLPSAGSHDSWHIG